jgi:hypothetical protein
VQATVNGIKLKIYANDIEYFENDMHAGHFIIDGEYFFEMQDVAEQNITIEISGKGYEKHLYFYEVLLWCEDWIENQYYFLDPLSGVINFNTETYRFTLDYTWHEPSLEAGNIKDFDISFCFVIITILIIVMMIVVYTSRPSIW